MDLYHVVLFVHVAAAIVLVGGSVAMDVVGHLAGRARTVGSLRDHVNTLSTLSKVVNPAAPVVLVAGLYMAFAARLWGSGWVPVALGLFLLSGAVAMGVLDPRVKRMVATLEEVPDGPITPELGARIGALAAPVSFAGSVLLGVDGAIVFLMTNKPGYVGSAATAAVGVTVGLALALRGRRHAAAPAAPAAPAA